MRVGRPFAEDLPLRLKWGITTRQAKTLGGWEYLERIPETSTRVLINSLQWGKSSKVVNFPSRNACKVAYLDRYGIEHTTFMDRLLSKKVLLQLGACRSEEARRILLGVSEKFAEGELAA